MIDHYFKYPLVYDYCIAICLCSTVYYLNLIHVVEYPSAEHTFSTATDLSTIALTLAGFVLTLLTVLITFKTGAKIPSGAYYDDIPVFDIFFSTKLYFLTTDLLKGAIKSLIFVSVFGFVLKMSLNACYIKYMFFSNILCLIIIVMTLWRSLLILTKIINLQKQQ